MPMPGPPKDPASPLASFVGHHVAVRVPDYERAEQWYLDKLDFRVVHEWPYGDLRLAYLLPPAADTFHVEILGGALPSPKTVYSDVATSLQEGGYHHFCMRVDSVADTVAQLRRRGVTTGGEPFDLADISSRPAFFADPWGNMIEISEDLG
jgi:glyoxylase I family protein